MLPICQLIPDTVQAVHYKTTQNMARRALYDARFKPDLERVAVRLSRSGVHTAGQDSRLVIWGA